MQELIYHAQNLVHGFWEYFFVFSRNTLPHLVFFMLILLLAFFFRHRKEYNEIRNSVKKVPLVVGGWGTRGKSGTERKKCALFETMGLEVYSKTTGCEAMFLHSMPNSNALELYLFRPYDKATIWEQGRTVTMAAKLQAQVMCWECMALNPEYVRILQQEWMRDTVTTLTNTYPDHEDIQGPSGRDIPYVMNNFIPNSGVVFTAEEQMYPILEEESTHKKTVIYPIDWREAFYLSSDVVDRYPYSVHPENLALVLKMARYLGADYDYSLKEMAHRIVPDIGVLKIYGPATVLGRKLVFFNGCSANERRGFLSNWTRMRFDQHLQQNEPHKWIVTVVNNRADRIPRSKVFADILVMDIAVHRHILIGTNLAGLKGYIDESMKRRLESLDLPLSWNENQPTVQEQEDYLRGLLADLKYECYDMNDVRLSIRFMLEGLGYGQDASRELTAKFEGQNIPEFFADALDSLKLDDLVREDFLHWADLFFERHVDFENLRDEFVTEVKNGDLDAARWRIREAFYKGFMDRLLIIEDALVNGDQIVYFMARHVPPGFETRLLGAQNIKGTGLDFVYRWLALEKTLEAVDALESPNPQRRADALEYFATSKEYGLLNTESALAGLNKALEAEPFQTIDAQREIKRILEQIAKTRVKLKDVEVAEGGKGSQSFLLLLLESILESGESKRRMKQSLKIYDLLCSGLISHERAAQVLRKITKEQKGGWLGDRIKQWRKNSKKKT